MALLAVQDEGAMGQSFGDQPHAASDPSWQRNRDFVDLDGQAVAVPLQRRGTDRQAVGVAVERPVPAFGHGPTGARAVERYVQTDMVFGGFAPRPGVVGREDAADEGDDRQSVVAVVAERVQVPPAIPAGADRRREVESASRHSTASRPDSAAIGTPGPGCTLPPAR